MVAVAVRIIMERLLTVAVLAATMTTCQAARTEVAASDKKATTEQAVPTQEVTAERVEIGATPTRVRIAPKSGKLLAQHVDALRSGRRLLIVVRGVQAEEPPATAYFLYLDLPPGVTPAEDDPRFIGSINFYDSYAGGDASKFRSFDITDVAKSLRARGLLQDATTITLRPGGDPGKDAKALLGTIELIEE